MPGWTVQYWESCGVQTTTYGGAGKTCRKVDSAVADGARRLAAGATFLWTDGTELTDSGLCSNIWKLFISVDNDNKNAHLPYVYLGGSIECSL